MAAPLSSAAATTYPPQPWRNVPRFGSYGNNDLADCALAAAADLQQLFDVEAGGSGALLSSQEITADFAALGGSGADTGVSVSAVEALWSERGIGGGKIAGMAEMPTVRTDVLAALRSGGGLYAIVNLPLDDNVIPDEPTSVVPRAWAPSSRRSISAQSGPSHAVAVVGSWRGGLEIVTWGSVVPVTWAWWNAFAAHVFSIER